MTPTLSEQDFELARQAIEQDIAGKMSKPGARTGYALDFELLRAFGEHVLLPILVSVSGRGLYDVIKGRKAAEMDTDETEKTNRSFVGTSVNEAAPLTAECLGELKAQLLPLGFTEDEITALYDKARKRLIGKSP